MLSTLSLPKFPGPVFGNMDNFTGLGVFVDTYPNEEKHIEVCDSRPQTVCEGKAVEKGSKLKGFFAELCKEDAIVFFCATIWRQAQKKRYTPRTQVTRLSASTHNIIKKNHIHSMTVVAA